MEEKLGEEFINTSLRLVASLSRSLALFHGLGPFPSPGIRPSLEPDPSLRLDPDPPPDPGTVISLRSWLLSLLKHDSMNLVYDYASTGSATKSRKR